MPVPNHTPDDPDIQRHEIQLSPEQYLTVIVKPDEGKNIVEITRYQQTPAIEGVEQEVMEILNFMHIDDSSNTVTIFIAENVVDLHDKEDLL